MMGGTHPLALGIIMPQPHAEPYEPRTADYRYRVTALHSDDVIPPAVPGEVAMMTKHIDRAGADVAIEIAVARTDLGRILLEERLVDDVEGRKNQWHVIHSWTRTAEGWRHR
jgi:hypothetical protein